MNVKPIDTKIRDLLISGKQYIIPRFQREYSWEIANWKEFLEDMLNCLSFSEGKVTTSNYFLGTMLFVEDETGEKENESFVVDGQQRITTITILFSVLSDIFIREGEESLSEQIFKYIMTKDDNGEEVRILKSKTHYPFFAYFIQDRTKKFSVKASNDEEKCINEAYNYFASSLSEESVKTYLEIRNKGIRIDEISYIDIIKTFRDQILQTVFISISTPDQKQANMIYEILNAKGKRLANIDLIKNKIFEVLNKEEPVDFASDKWSSINMTLNSKKETIGLATYFRHYWSSKHGKIAEKNIYSVFNKTITKKAEEYECFLIDLEENAKTYMRIVNPQREDYENKKQYYWLVQSLNHLSNYFNVVQVRIVLLTVLDLKMHELITMTNLEKVVIFLENFHFAYNFLCSKRTNILEGIYSSFSLAARKCNSKEDVQIAIRDKIYQPLSQKFPSYEEFQESFCKLKYSKKDIRSNIKSKYVINKLHCFCNKSELFCDTGSIEHIIPEEAGLGALQIGNLLLLEVPLNNEADNKEYIEKRSIYQKSSYKQVKEFLEKYPNFEMTDIETRSIELSKFYYEAIKKAMNIEE